MAKTAIFSWNFDLFLTFFMDCGYIYVPKLMMSLFLLWGRPFITGDGPKMAKHGRLVNASVWSIWAQKGQKWSTYVFLTILDPFGPIWTLLDHFKQESIFCSEAPLPPPTLFIWGKKSILSKMVQKGSDGRKRGPKWSKTLMLTILVAFGPFWTTLEH